MLLEEYTRRKGLGSTPYAGGSRAY